MADLSRFDAFIKNAKSKKQARPDFTEVLRAFNEGKHDKAEKVEKVEKADKPKKQPIEDFLNE